MKVKLKKFVSYTLALTGVLGAMGAGWYTSTPAKASSATVDVALSTLTPTATSCKTFQTNQNSNGSQLALLQNGQEVTYETALLTVPAANSYASVYFLDVQENGYQRFQADVGLDASVRTKDAAVEFKVIADGKQVYTSGTVTNTTPAQSVDVDLTDVEVLQLVVDAKGANTNDQAVWGNARFTKVENAPYLAVDDLEFNQSWQVTEENILEYVSARDVNGNDITDRITYETNYEGQASGTYSVTYTATDEAGNTHSRTVDLVVTGEDYTQELTLERLRQPWADYLYHGRGTLDSQGKKAWDLVLSQVLDFDPGQWNLITKSGEQVYEIDVDLQANGIFATQPQLTSLCSMFMDDEPRTFILKDWGCTVTTKDGLASHVKMWAKKSMVDQYDAMLLKIEGNAQTMLAKYQPDMTEAQALYYVSNAYKNWLKYGNVYGQLLSDSLGNGEAVCGGNARGYIYLSQRLGTKSVWGRSGSHAWSFTKLVDVKEWFKTDLLSGEFLAPGKNGEGNLSVGGNYKSRHYKWFVFGTEQYDKNLLRYPSVWVEVARSEVPLPINTNYNLYSYVSDFGSIFNQSLTKDSINITVDKVNQDGTVLEANVDNFPTSGSSNDLAVGYYRVTYTISDQGRTNTASLIVWVSGASAVPVTYADRQAASATSGVQNPLGLWDGSAEKWYDKGIYINNGGYVTYNVEGRNYKYMTFDFGIKNSVRDNVNYGYYGKVAVRVEVTTSSGVETLYEGSVLGWKTKYEGVSVKLPDDAISVTIRSLDKGNGNGHAGIGALTFYQDSAVSMTYADRQAASADSGVQNPLGLWTGSAEKWYDNGIFINNGGYVTYSAEGYKYMSFDFGIKNSVRNNTAYGHYGKVAVRVEVTTPSGVETLYEGSVLGWKSKYESVFVELPSDAISVTIRSLDKGSGNGHAGIGGLTFYQDSAVSVTYADRQAASADSGVQNPLGLWTGSAEKWYDNGIFINNGGYVTYNVEGKNYRSMTFDFGIKNSVRNNTAYGYYGKVAVRVEITTSSGVETVYEGSVLGWKAKYESVSVNLPNDAISVTIRSLDKGSGNGHAGIGGLTFFRDLAV